MTQAFLKDLELYDIGLDIEIYKELLIPIE
jgi:hypothetical protein